MLKHRLLVTDDLDKYSYQIPGGNRTLAAPAVDLEVVRLPMTEDRVYTFLQNTVMSGKMMEQLAHLDLTLDRAGIDPYM